MPPSLIVRSSSSFPQYPPMCTNCADSWKSFSKCSTSFSAIHFHLLFERSIKVCCSGVNLTGLLTPHAATDGEKQQCGKQKSLHNAYRFISVCH